MIECYYTLNTKGFTDELSFGYFNDQLIPSNYYNFLNYDNENGNNIPGNLVYDAFQKMKEWKMH